MRSKEGLLGTRAVVHVDAPDDCAVERLEVAVFDEVDRLERIFTVFDDTSPLRTGRFEVAELAEVIQLAAQWIVRTNAMFNPRVHTLVELWDAAEAADQVPTQCQLDEVTAAIQRASEPCNNLNGVAKGWIAQAAIDTVCRPDTACASAWLNLGGDVVHYGDRSLQVAIEDPLRPYDNAAPVATVDISNEALATSGGSRRWWTIGGSRYAKVLDPRTGSPVDRIASATVIAGDAATADVLATTALIASEDETMRLVAESAAACLLVNRDGSTAMSSERFVVAAPG